MPQNSRGRHALVRAREVSMRKSKFNKRQIALIPTKAAVACPCGGTTYCSIVPEAPGQLRAYALRSSAFFEVGLSKFGSADNSHCGGWPLGPWVCSIDQAVVADD